MAIKNRIDALIDRLKAAGDHYGIPVERDFAEAAECIIALRDGLRSVAFMRPLGPTRNKMVERMELTAIDALAKAEGRQT